MKTRSYVKHFDMSINGKLATRGSLYSVRATKQSYTMCTPEMKRVRQIYIDEGGQIWEHADLIRGIDLGDGGDLVPIGTSPVETVTEIRKAKTSALPLNKIEFDVYPSEDVERYTYPSKNQGYLFKVAADTKDGGGLQYLQNYKAMLALLKVPGVALLGKSNVQHQESLVRASLFRGNIVVQSYMYPEDINDFDDLEVYEGLGSLEEKMRKVAPQLMKPFNPDEFQDIIAKNQRDLIQRREIEISEEAQADALINELLGV